MSSPRIRKELENTQSLQAELRDLRRRVETLEQLLGLRES
jgi:hypothetical protein